MLTRIDLERGMMSPKRAAASQANKALAALSPRRSHARLSSAVITPSSTTTTTTTAITTAITTTATGAAATSIVSVGEASMLPIIVTTGDTTTDDRNYRYLKEQNTFIFLMKKPNQNLVELIRLLYESMLSAARINTWPTE